MSGVVELDRVSAEAQRAPVRPLRAALTAVAGVLYGIGWVARSAVYAVSWSWSAVKLGWRDADARFGGPAAKR